MLIPSKSYTEFERQSRWYVPKLKEPISQPVNLKVHFYMPTRRRVDLVNLLEAACDMLTYWRVIEDDNFKVVHSMDGSRVRYDKEHPRLEITITEVKP